MNREILFRGKQCYIGEWVYGYLAEDGCGLPVIETARFMSAVEPDTIGQSTGLTDKNGKRIFEGDLITIPESKRQGLPAPVMWSKNDAKFEIRRRGFNPIPFDEEWGVYEIVGNIHDNPELLEGKLDG